MSTKQPIIGPIPKFLIDASRQPSLSPLPCASSRTSAPQTKSPQRLHNPLLHGLRIQWPPLPCDSAGPADHLPCFLSRHCLNFEAAPRLRLLLLDGPRRHALHRPQFHIRCPPLSCDSGTAPSPLATSTASGLRLPVDQGGDVYVT